MSLPWRTAWITGASTGIGRALALQLAAQGVQVAASARSADKLAALAGEAAGITAFPVDVTDAAAMRAAYARLVADMGPLDLCILNAGVWEPMASEQYVAQRAVDSMAVNYAGIAHALEPLIPDMIARGRGQIALVGSVAGYRGLPKAAAYAPTKAAVIALAEVLRIELTRHGITVSLVNPGFVDTPMTQVNRFPMPFLLDVNPAATRIIAGLRSGAFETAFPRRLVLPLKILRLLPNRVYLALVRRFMLRD